jgi:hypothetical protein
MSIAKLAVSSQDGPDFYHFMAALHSCQVEGLVAICSSWELSLSEIFRILAEVERILCEGRARMAYSRYCAHPLQPSRRVIFLIGSLAVEV